MNCFRESAKNMRISLQVVAGDASPEWSAACQLADRFHRLPLCADTAYIEKVLKICNDESIRAVIPTIDTELQIFADNRSEFEKNGIRLVVSSPETIEITGDKSKTAACLQRQGLNVPKTWEIADLPAIADQPMILKPRSGSSSIGILYLEAGQPIPELSDPGSYIAQNLLTGREFTVNAYVSMTGKLLAAVPHWRAGTRSGEVSKGRTERIPELQQAAEQIVAALPGLSGPFCFQAFFNEGEDPVIFEINARFGGGYPLAHQAGAQFTRFILEEITGHTPNPVDDWQDHLTFLRYDSAVFL